MTAHPVCAKCTKHVHLYWMACVPVDPGAKGAGLIQAEPRCKQSSLMQQKNQVLHSLVALVSICTLAQLLQRQSIPISKQSDPTPSMKTEKEGK